MQTGVGDLSQQGTEMYRPERSSSPFSLLDMDMWDTNLTAQSSAWCGMSRVSGSGFMSKVNTSSSGGGESFRQTDSGLRKWQSLSQLAPNISPRSFSPSPPSDLRSARGQSPFRQTGVMQWLQDAQQRMDPHMDLLRERIPYSVTQLDMKHRERHTSDTEIFKLKRALREAESKAKKQEEECEQTILRLKTATETQKSLRSQTTDLNQRLTQTLQNLTELQEQLREANNKISRACLEKATLSTQVLKLEESVRELTLQVKTAQDDKDNLTQEKADLQEKVDFLELQLETNITESTAQRNEPAHDGTNDEKTAELKQEVAALEIIRDDLLREMEATKQTLNTSQSEVGTLQTEKASTSQRMVDLETECVALRSRIPTHGESLEDLKEELTRLEESLKSSQLEKQRQQDRCLFLETAVFEKEQELRLLEENCGRTDAGRVRNIAELKVVLSHWTEKWQRAALALQSAESELEELRRRGKNESESYLRLELNACKQELELVKSRSQAMLNKQNRNGGDTLQTQDKETMTDSRHQSHQNKLEAETAGGTEDVEDCTNAHMRESVKERQKTEIQLEQEKTDTVLKPYQYQPKDQGTSAEERGNINTEQQTLVDEQLKSLQEKEENEMSGDGSAQDWIQTPMALTRHDRWGWHPDSGLMPVFEEEEPEDEDQDDKTSAETETISSRDPLLLRTTSSPALDQDLLLCPDGIFQVEMVDICSPDEDEATY